jgi:hypothetical protein
MAKFTVEVREVLLRLVEVEAEDAEQAEAEVTAQYEDEEIVLDSDDFDSVEITEINQL